MRADQHGPALYHGSIIEHTLDLYQQLLRRFGRGDLTRQGRANRPRGQVPKLPDARAAFGIGTPSAGMVGELIGKAQLFAAILDLRQQRALRRELVGVIGLEQARLGQILLEFTTKVRPPR